MKYKYDFEKLKITPVLEKHYDGTKTDWIINDEIGLGSFNCSFPEIEKIKIYKVLNFFYFAISRNYFWFRFFNKYGLYVKDKTKTLEMFSERNNYKKFWDIGKYRIKILK